MPEIMANGIPMYYLDEGSGEPLVFLHGLGSCADDWILQWPCFAPSFRAIAADLRGHGRSGKPAGPYSVALFASDIAALLDSLSVGPAHVVGLSLGGLVAQQLAIDSPHGVRSLTLINTFAHLLSGSVFSLARLLRRGILSLVLPMRHNAAHIAAELFPLPHQVELRRLAAQRLAANDRAAYRASIGAIRRFDSRSDLHRISCPTLVVTGQRDRTVPRDRQRVLVRGIRGARWELIPDSGHATPIDRADAYNALQMEFLCRAR